MSEHQVTRSEGCAQSMDVAAPETARAFVATAPLSRPAAESQRRFAKAMEQAESEHGRDKELSAELDSAMHGMAQDGGTTDSPSPSDILSSMAGSMVSSQALTSPRTRVQAHAHREGQESEEQSGQGRKMRQRHQERTLSTEGAAGTVGMTLRESTAQTVLVSEAPEAKTGGETAETLIATVAERILVADRPQGTGEVRIQLHSSVLPEAEVRLARQADGGLQVLLVTNNYHTFQAFVDAQAALQTRLERFEDAGVRIVVTAQAEADSGDARQRSRGEYVVDAEDL